MLISFAVDDIVGIVVDVVAIVVVIAVDVVVVKVVLVENRMPEFKNDTRCRLQEGMQSQKFQAKKEFRTKSPKTDSKLVSSHNRQNWCWNPSLVLVRVDILGG